MTGRDVADVYIGRSRRVGTLPLVSFLISASAPMTVLAGGVVATFAVTGVLGVPLSFPILAAALALFTVGYAAMSRYVLNAGAFYAYLAQGLGPAWGIGGAGVALLSYNTIQIGLYGLFGVVASGFAEARFGLSWSWWAWALVVWAIVGICGVARVDLSAVVLSVLLAAEILAVVVFDVGAFTDPAGDRVTVRSLWPGELFGPGIGGVFAFGVAAFIGFESGGAYVRDVKDPRRTVARATYITLAIIGVLYTLSAWALTLSTGEDNIIGAARDPESGIPFSFIAGRYGETIATIANVLLITSVFAALLSFHNTTARYTFALGREGVLPGVMGRTGAVSGAPIVGSVTQSAVALVVVVAFAALGRDPMTELFTWGSYIAAVGLIAIMIAVSIAVTGYFRGRDLPETPWERVVAPTLATFALVAIEAVTVVNSDSVLGAEAGSILTYLLPGLVVIVAVVFAAGAFVLRTTKPTVYRGIGWGGTETRSIDELSRLPDGVRSHNNPTTGAEPAQTPARLF